MTEAQLKQQYTKFRSAMGDYLQSEFISKYPGEFSIVREDIIEYHADILAASLLGLYLKRKNVITEDNWQTIKSFVHIGAIYFHRKYIAEDELLLHAHGNGSNRMEKYFIVMDTLTKTTRYLESLQECIALNKPYIEIPIPEEIMDDGRVINVQKEYFGFLHDIFLSIVIDNEGRNVLASKNIWDERGLVVDYMEHFVAFLQKQLKD